MDLLRYFLSGFFTVILLLCISGCPNDNGNPAIEFTHVPPYGSFEDLEGRVWHVKPVDYKVAVYIYVSGWWNKPYWDNPLTNIRADGSWICDITTGGVDQYATKIAAYLVPDGYNPPLMDGDTTLPTELDQKSVTKIDTTREAILRQIVFSGHRWKVKSSETLVGPGPNYFSNSEENVWVDEQGQLHLKITKRNGRWCCAEVISEKNFGYGKYVFYLASRIDQLNENAVVGLFTWDDAPEYNHREIDIEFSRWGQLTNDNAQFVVQPWDHPGNMYRFNIQLDEDYSTHSFNWSSENISFQSLYGHYSTHPDDSYIIDLWNYTGGDIPKPGNENTRINLWLLNGDPPSDSMEAEIVIKKFEFIP
jgi:hypothetical protein